jgi:GT2 family glycosyltransferase
LHSVALVRRSLFERISFDPWYTGNAYREETDFFLTANEMGYKVWFSPDVVCYHLRGPISASGGQRINRLAVEYYNILNTYHMVKKHWPYLTQEHGFRGTPLTWTWDYALWRETTQGRRMLKSGFRSTFRG